MPVLRNIRNWSELKIARKTNRPSCRFLNIFRKINNNVPLYFSLARVLFDLFPKRYTRRIMAVSFLTRTLLDNKKVVPHIIHKTARKKQQFSSWILYTCDVKEMYEYFPETKEYYWVSSDKKRERYLIFMIIITWYNNYG